MPADGAGSAPVSPTVVVNVGVAKCVTMPSWYQFETRQDCTPPCDCAAVISLSSFAGSLASAIQPSWPPIEAPTDRSVPVGPIVRTGSPENCAWAPEAVLFAWNALDAEQPGTFLTDNWDVVPRFLAAGAVVSAVLTTLALLVSSFATRRAYATVAMLAVLFIGSAIGGIAENDFSGGAADAVSLVSLPQSLVDAVHWIFGDEVDRPVSGGVALLWLLALTAVLAAWLLRRTNRLVRG